MKTHLILGVLAILGGGLSPNAFADDLFALGDEASCIGRCSLPEGASLGAVEGKKFDWQSNDRLRRALELKLFEDQKDSIKLKTLVSAVVDKETQEKIDIIKARLIRYFGYNEVSATDVLNYVASIYARGDAT